MTNNKPSAAHMEKALKVSRMIVQMARDNNVCYKISNKETADNITQILLEMILVDSKEKADKFINALKLSFKFHKPTVYLWTYLCMNANWLSWAWYELGHYVLSEAWADAWYNINDFSLDSLKGSDLEYYIKTTD